MQQVLFNIPILKDWFPPDGLPIHGFGVMLFITFIVGVWFLGRLATKMGSNLPKDKVQDLVIVTFVGGLLGARITYMIQYGVPLKQALRIWEGGIVLYGGIIVGIFAFLAYHRIFLKKAGVSLWKLADAAGPTLALGIALGRIGCLLNGCCYGHVAPEGCPSLGFPLLTCPSRDLVVDRQAYQTPTGFTVKPEQDGIVSVVDKVEPGSNAEKAGLLPGDRIMKANNRPNAGVLLVFGEKDALDRAATLAREQNAIVEYEPEATNPRVRISVEDKWALVKLKNQINAQLLFRVRVSESDEFTDLINAWPRGQQSLELSVDRGGRSLWIGPFVPRTLGLHPTQVYETISMLLLVVLLLAFYPFRRHDGQVFTLFVFCYAIHRFLNESLRNDTDIVGIPQLNMSLSQNISVLMLLFAVGLEIGLRWKGKTRAST